MNPESNQAAAADPQPQTLVPFKNYKAAFKAMRELTPPISDERRNEYLDRLCASSSARYVAFQLLALRAMGEMPAKLAPFIAALEEILYKDAAPLDLRGRESIESVKEAVLERLASVRGKKDLQAFAAAGSHLPILYALIRLWDDPARFQAGLDALAAVVAKSPTKGKPSEPRSNLEVLARALIGRVPEKPMLGKTLPELLKITQLFSRQAEVTNQENLDLQFALSTARDEIASLEEKLDSEVAAHREVATKNGELEAELARLQRSLEEEKEHFETLKGHTDEDRQRSVEDAVARVRSEVLRRLDNIRLFADRDQPNYTGILSLVSEIQDALKEAER